MTDRYVETKEILNKVSSMNRLLGFVSNNSYRMKPRTIDDYKSMLEQLVECENKIRYILINQGVKDMSPAQIRKYSESVSTDTSKTRSEAAVIMYNYRTRLPQVCKINFEVNDVNVLVDLMNDWFTKRFKVSSEVSFRYNATKIWSYIDAFIISYGYYVHRNESVKFLKQLFDWLEDIDEGGVQYPLPRFISDMYKDIDNVTPEAVVLENYIKPSLYDSTFNSDKLTTILDMYRRTWEGIAFEEIQSRSRV